MLSLLIVNSKQVKTQMKKKDRKCRLTNSSNQRNNRCGNSRLYRHLRKKKIIKGMIPWHGTESTGNFVVNVDWKELTAGVNRLAGGNGGK